MSTEPSRHTVQAGDGTTICCESVGAGRALVIVPGAISDAETWRGVACALASAMRVVTIDRRGRGGSGGAPPWRPEDELDDVRAVMAEVGPEAIVMGHSSGGVLALSLALSGCPLSGLVLYEPAIFPVADTPEPQFAAEVEALLARGESEAALERFVRGVKSGSDAEVRRRRADADGWRRAVGHAWTIPADMAVVASYRFDAAALAEIGAPALMIIGGESPRATREGSEAVAAALPDCAVTQLPGQGHEAAVLAPRALAGAVLAFCAQQRLIGPVASARA